MTINLLLFSQQGAVLDPMEVWLAHRSPAMLDVRLERQCKNALEIARFPVASQRYALYDILACRRIMPTVTATWDIRSNTCALTMSSTLILSLLIHKTDKVFYIVHLTLVLERISQDGHERDSPPRMKISFQKSSQHSSSFEGQVARYASTTTIHQIIEILASISPLVL